MATGGVASGLRRYELDGVCGTGREVGHGSYAVVKELKFRGLKCDFTKSTDPDIRVSSIFVLGYMESKLTVDQRHHLQLQSQDVQFVTDMLLESISTGSTFSSPIPLLKALQIAIKAEQGNAQTLVSQGIFSTAYNALAADNNDVQRETILLLWILACIPTYAEKARAHSNLIHALQNLQGSSDHKLALASTCVLWDITGGRKTGM